MDQAEVKGAGVLKEAGLSAAALQALQQLPPADREAALREFRSLVLPAIPGSARDMAATYTCLGLTDPKFSPRQVLEEFAGADSGTEEFRYADAMRKHVRDRLAGELPDRYAVYLIGAAGDRVFYETARAAVFKAALFYEFEHLRGHAQFYHQYQDTQWVKSYSPRHFIKAATLILEGGRNHRHGAEPVYRRLQDDIRGYLEKMELTDLTMAWQTGGLRWLNTAPLAELVAKKRDQDPQLARQVFDEQVLDWWRIWYADDKKTESAPLRGISRILSQYREEGARDLAGIVRFAVRTLQETASAENQAVLRNLRADIVSGLADPKQAGFAAALCEECPELK